LRADHVANAFEDMRARDDQAILLRLAAFDYALPSHMRYIVQQPPVHE
jgi:hypothetical protein